MGERRGSIWSTGGDTYCKGSVLEHIEYMDYEGPISIGIHGVHTQLSTHLMWTLSHTAELRHRSFSN